MIGQLININARVTEKPEMQEVCGLSVKLVIRLEACNGPYTMSHMQLILPYFTYSDLLPDYSKIRDGDLLSLEGRLWRQEQEPYSVDIGIEEMTIKRDESTTVFSVSTMDKLMLPLNIQ